MQSRSHKIRLSLTTTVAWLLGSTSIWLTTTINVSAEDAPQTIRFEREQHHGFRSHCGGVSYESNVEPWLGRCEQRIRHAGFDEDKFKDRKLEVRIDVKQGEIGTLHISKSSGSAAVDRAALELLINASPLELPEIRLPRDRPLFAEFDYPRLELKFHPLDQLDIRSGKDPYVPENAKYARSAHY